MHGQLKDKLKPSVSLQNIPSTQAMFENTTEILNEPPAPNEIVHHNPPTSSPATKKTENEQPPPQDIPPFFNQKNPSQFNNYFNFNYTMKCDFFL